MDIMVDPLSFKLRQLEEELEEARTIIENIVHWVKDNHGVVIPEELLSYSNSKSKDRISGSDSGSFNDPQDDYIDVDPPESPDPPEPPDIKPIFATTSKFNGKIRPCFVNLGPRIPIPSHRNSLQPPDPSSQAALDHYSNLKPKNYLSQDKLTCFLCPKQFKIYPTVKSAYKRHLEIKHQVFPDYRRRKPRKSVKRLKPKSLPNEATVKEIHQFLDNFKLKDYSNKILACRVCGTTFKTRPTLKYYYKTHLKEVHGLKFKRLRIRVPNQGDFEPDPAQESEMKGFLENFNWSDYIEKNLECAYCSRDFYPRIGLRNVYKRHLKDVHNFKFLDPLIIKFQSSPDPEIIRKFTPFSKPKYPPPSPTAASNALDHYNNLKLSDYSNQASFNCYLCPKQFGIYQSAKCTYKRHLESKHGLIIAEVRVKRALKRELEPPSVNLRQEIKEFLDNFKLEDYSDKKLACQVCGQTFKTRQNLKHYYKSHLKDVHDLYFAAPRLRIPNQPHFAPDAALEFEIKGFLESVNWQKDFTDKNLECAVCKRHFNTRPGLKYVYTRHLKNVHNFKFGEASKKSQILRFPKPKTSKNSPGVETCPICFKVYASNYLPKHIQYIHRKEGVRKFLCSICGAAAQSKSYLERHMRIHSEERPFKCGECDYSGKQKEALAFHIRKHHQIQDQGRPKQICEICGAQFEIRYNLKKHIQGVHEGLRPHPCPFACGKSFKTKENLKYHIKTHSNPNSKQRGLNKPR